MSVMPRFVNTVRLTQAVYETAASILVAVSTVKSFPALMTLPFVDQVKCRTLPPPLGRVLTGLRFQFELLRDSWHELFILTAAQYFSDTDVSLLHEEHRSAFGTPDIGQLATQFKETLSAIKRRQIDPIEHYLLNEIVLLKSGNNPRAGGRRDFVPRPVVTPQTTEETIVRRLEIIIWKL